MAKTLKAELGPITPDNIEQVGAILSGIGEEASGSRKEHDLGARNNRLMVGRRR
jgi:hypothetical protein